MPVFDKLDATFVARARVREDLFGFEVEKAPAHRAMAHHAFEMARAAAVAKALFRIERDDRVPALPDALRLRVAPEADAAADRPDANNAIEMTERHRDTGCHCIGVIQIGHRRIDT